MKPNKNIYREVDTNIDLSELEENQITRGPNAKEIKAHKEALAIREKNGLGEEDKPKEPKPVVMSPSELFHNVICNCLERVHPKGDKKKLKLTMQISAKLKAAMVPGADKVIELKEAEFQFLKKAWERDEGWPNNPANQILIVEIDNKLEESKAMDHSLAIASEK